MALTESKTLALGAPAPEFNLRGVDGKDYTLRSFFDRRALWVTFMCNHCPYVIAVQDRINTLAHKWMAEGVGVIAINSNDPNQYPDDSMDKMKLRAAEKKYVFPYVQDLDQSAARAYDAVCTPEFFVFEGRGGTEFLLRYHGRLDDSWKDPQRVTQRDLDQAISDVVSGQRDRIDALIKRTQWPSMGCNIKWAR